MYIVAIAWIYVVLLMAFTEASFAAGAATFIFYGLAPLSILLYLMGTPQRRRNRRRREASRRRRAPGSQKRGDARILLPWLLLRTMRTRTQTDERAPRRRRATWREMAAATSAAEGSGRRRFLQSCSQMTPAMRPQTPSRR